jgi:hypothetical protein
MNEGGPACGCGERRRKTEKKAWVADGDGGVDSAAAAALLLLLLLLLLGRSEVVCSSSWRTKRIRFAWV